jgi:hypothetical protein
VKEIENQNAFYPRRFQTAKEAFQFGFNERYWTHGIVVSQGNGMYVSRDEANLRLRCIKRHLLRAIFGNHWRDKGDIQFSVFPHGSFATGDQHFHALMHIRGNHDWSDFRVAMTIRSIEIMRHAQNKATRQKHWEKMAHVDWDWRKDNRYHGYVSRYADKRPDTWYSL